MKTFTELLAETVRATCRRCLGYGSGKRWPHSYCPDCEGEGKETVNRYSLLTDAQRVTVLEAEVLRLQGLLADRYETPPVVRMIPNIRPGQTT